jgi:hypothetical protein
MKPALNDQIEHRLQDRFPLIAFASHIRMIILLFSWLLDLKPSQDALRR